jgi:gluconolactonase
MIPLVLVALAFAMPDGPAKSPFPAGAKPELLWSEGTFTEGPALAPDGAIVFSDIGDRILRFDPSSRKVTVFREPSGRANGLVFDSQGRLIAAEGANTGGKRRVSITERDGTIRTLADGHGGKRFNSPNDLAIDADGRIYVSDPRYVGDEPRQLDDEAVYRIDPNGKVAKLETAAKKPNGLALSPDGKTLYVADTGPTRSVLLALPIKPDGSLGKARTLKDFGNGRGIDGLTVAGDGSIVAAAGGGILAGVYVYSPAGIPLGFIATPEVPSNVEFGGPDRSTLYITAGKSLYRVETNLKGR